MTAERRAYLAEWRRKRRDHLRAYHAQWRAQRRSLRPVRSCAECSEELGVRNRTGICRSCYMSAHEKSRLRDPEKLRAYQQTPERVAANRENAKRWREQYPEKARAVAKKSRKTNREAYLERHRRNQQIRRARKKNALVERVNPREVFERDNYICQSCGLALTFAQATLDHIIPLSRSGLHSYGNTQTLCHSCNCRKGARLEVA